MILAANLDELMTMPVSIATQSPTPISKAPSVVSVITAEDIRATGTANLMEILQSVPGLFIRVNQFGYRPLISFRGSPNAHVLLMVNGAPLRDLVWSSGIFWKGLPASMIERVEIVRGPGSALFGSDAAAGAINVITKTAGKLKQSEAGIRLGSFNTRTAWLEHGTRWQDLDIGLTAEFSQTDGHRPYIAADRQSNGNLVSYAPGDAQLGYDNTDVRFSIAGRHWRFLADHMQKDNLAIGFTGAGILDPVTRANDRQTSLALLYNHADFAPHWGLDAELRYRDLETSSGNGFWEKPGSNLNQMRAKERRLNVEVSGIYRGLQDHAIRVGGGHVRQDYYHDYQVLSGVPAVFVPEQARTNRYVFVQDVWGFAKDWELTAGGRYDDYAGEGNAFNPRLALVWQTSARLTSKLMYGQAFRVPSYLELYALTAATRANPNLQPEKTRTLELAFHYAASRDLKLGFNLFRYEQLNPILDAGGVFVHGDKHAIRGIEVEANWQVSQTLRLAGNATQRYQDYWPYVIFYAVPDAEAYLRADWTFMPKWNWNLQANWTGQRQQARTDPRARLGAQTVVDTTVRYYHGSQWEFAASIRNLLDEDIREYAGTAIRDYLPSPRRNAFIEVRYKF